MVSKSLVIAAVIAYVEARFGQEQVPIAAISAVQGGDAGAAATIAGAAISDLLGAANSCAKLTRADQVFTELGGGADALAAAIGLVTAEKNTNPFANGNAQNVCGDPTLPVTPELRGITPLIDPDVDVDGAVAALSQSSAASPLAADGLSVFDLLDQAGLGDLVVSQAAAGGAAAGDAQQGNQQANNNNQQAANNNNQQANDQQDATADDNAADACDADNANDDAAADNSQNAAAGNNTDAAAGGAASSLAGADFGQCTPTITFQGGEGNRPDTEFTFQIADPVARGGQGEALNPNIITNALCNQLTNVCDANDAAKAACEDAKAQVEAAGTRDKSTADLFNSLLGFAGAVTNPAGGPENPPAAARSMRRGRRAL
ncbi:Nn.00g001200.m01.CDS01 [Neocucurbitaria sp. VM-36]